LEQDSFFFLIIFVESNLASCIIVDFNGSGACSLNRLIYWGIKEKKKKKEEPFTNNLKDPAPGDPKTQVNYCSLNNVSFWIKKEKKNVSGI
jgi:hypothetical protein